MSSLYLIWPFGTIIVSQCKLASSVLKTQSEQKYFRSVGRDKIYQNETADHYIKKKWRRGCFQVYLLPFWDNDDKFCFDRFFPCQQLKFVRHKGSYDNTVAAWAPFIKSMSAVEYYYVVSSEKRTQNAGMWYIPTHKPVQSVVYWLTQVQHTHKPFYDVIKSF